jgi:hypothetical protein
VSAGDYRAVAVRTRRELVALEEVTNRANGAWAEATGADDDYHVDATALNLHGFYAGLERLFVIIAERVDESMPTGANWHQELLQQMSAELPGVRPTVISSSLAADLERFRGFRHVVRNVYAYVLDPRRIGELMDVLPGTFAAARSQLADFADALEAIARS